MGVDLLSGGLMKDCCAWKQQYRDMRAREMVVSVATGLDQCPVIGKATPMPQIPWFSMRSWDLGKTWGGKPQ